MNRLSEFLGLQRSTVILIMCVSALSAAFSIGYGLRFGKVGTDYLSDDNVYFFQALRMLDAFYEGGFGGLVSSYFAEPPHAPLVSGMIAIVFGVIGVSNWAPYLLGAVCSFVYLGSFMRFAETRSVWMRLGVAFVLLSIPIAQGLCLELRPEYPYAVLWLATVLLSLDSGRRRLLLSTGLWAGLFLMKPPFAPLTAALFGVNLIAEILRERDAGSGLFRLSKDELAFAAKRIGLLVLVVGPLLLPQAIYFYNYIYLNAFGEGAEIWTIKDSLGSIVFYHLSGAGASHNLGWILYPLLGAAVVCVPLALIRGDRESRSRMWQLLANFGLIWASFIAARPLNPFMGFVLQAAVFLLFAFSANALWRSLKLNSRTGALALAVAVGCAAAFGFQFDTWKWGGPNDLGRLDRTAIYPWMHDALRSQGGKEGEKLYFTFSSRLMNTHSLRWSLAKERIPVEVSEDRDTDDFETQLRGIAGADFVLAAEPGAAEVHGWLATGRIYGQSYEHMLAEPNFSRVSEFETYTGKRMVLYRRIQTEL